MSSKKIIAIGLEAVEPELLEKWCDEGLLPTIASLREKGAYRRMRSPAEVSSGASWSSINCGVTPGKHGMGFCHRQYKNGTYHTRKKRADEVGRLPFWTNLAADKRVFTMDVPETRTYDVNGVELVGWGLEYKAWKADSTPKGLMHKIEKEFGGHPLDDWYQTKANSVEGWLDLKKKVLWATNTRTRIAKKYLSQEKFDFALVAYAETHFGGHLFWHLNDKDHPDYDAEIEKAVGNPILEIYQACDAGIKELMALNPDATHFIFSNTGIGPNYSARHFTGEVLRRLGYRASNPTGNETNKSGLPSADVFAVEKYEKMFGQRNIQRVKAIVPEKIWDTLTRRFLAFGSDWKDSIAYDIPGDNTGTIRINLIGREPKGKVEPKDYDEVCDTIAKKFLAITDADTGESLVREVVRVHKKYPGENGGDLPDLLIKRVEGRQINAMTSPEIGEIRLDHLPDARTGAHKDYGFFLAVGGGIKHLNGSADEHEVYNWDFAPTALHIMGEPIPDDMDGKPMMDIFEEEEAKEQVA